MAVPDKKLTINPLFRDALPSLSSEELERLKSDIKANKVRDPVHVAEDGVLLDGHHRYSLEEDCPRFVVPGSGVWSDDERLAYVIRQNLNRRQLSASQYQALMKQTLQPLAFRLRWGVEMKAAKKKNAKRPKPVRAEKDVGRLLGTVQQTVSSWTQWPKKEAGISVTTAGNANIPDESEPESAPTPEPARVTTSIPKSEHERIWQRWRDGETQKEIADDYKVEQSRISQICQQVGSQHEADQKEEEQQAAASPEWPTKKYRCIVIDPPWPVEKIKREQRPNQPSQLDYKTMTLEEIEAMPVGDFGYSSGCQLYLWVTQKYLPVGLKLVELWGYSYQCLLTWVKPTGMTPYSWMYNTEHVIFATKGSSPVKKKGMKLAFEAKTPRGAHSTKPDVFFERVVAASDEPRLEMFARKERFSFDCWGDEV